MGNVRTIMRLTKAQWLLLLLPALLIPASAIYEDQAGTFDWYKQYVGRPTSVAFLSGKDRLYLTTNQNLLASLQTKAGQIVWRRRHTAQDTLEKSITILKPALVVAANNKCKTLRAWDALEGAFKWEALVLEGPVSADAEATCDITAVDLGPAKGTAVAVVAQDKLKLFAAQKGEELWSSGLEQASQGSRKVMIAANEVVSVLSYTPGSSDLYVLSVEAADGSHKDSEQFTAPTKLGRTAAVSGDAAAVLSQDGTQLCTVLLTDGLPSTGVSCQSIKAIAPALASNGKAALQLKAAGPGSFSISVSSKPGVAIVSTDGTTKWFADAVTASPASPTADSASSALVLVSSSPDASSITVQLLDASSHEVLKAATVAVPAPAYPVTGRAPHAVSAWLDAQRYKQQSSSSSKQGGLRACRVVLLWSDDRVSYVSGNEVAWTREEALASSTSNLIIDLPAAKQAPVATGQKRSRAGLLGLLQDKDKLQRWVRLQVLSVLVQFKLSSPQEQDEFLQLRQTLSDNNLPFRDTNGFRKLIVLLTEPGKVFALHSGDGRIMWASHGSTAVEYCSSTSASPSSSGTASCKQYLRMWKHYHDLKHAPELAVISAGDESSAVQVLHGHTGEVLHEQQLGYGVEKVIPQHQPVHDGAADQFLFLLVEPLRGSDSMDNLAMPRVHLLPDTPTAQQHISKISSSLFFWLLQAPEQAAVAATGADDSQKQTVLQGFGFEANAVPAGDTGVLPVVPAWQVVLPGQLLSVAAKDPAEPVHSYVKILGDRSLKYRYLNPNLLFVATGPSAAETAKLAPDEQAVTITILNTVTGGVVHQQLHHGCAGPVHAVLSENWVVYTLRDVVSLRQQATVIELYNASPHDLSIESVILGRTKHSAALSSYAAPPLEVLTQSFYLQHSVTGLGVTQTKQGITTKQLLVRTIGDQVYALDKRFLDPRRPLRAKVTPEEAEERLLPYNEFVVFSTLQAPTLDKQVLNLRGVTVAPAVLESTTLVFCHGTDLFFTRMTPALHFDSLQSDFSYGLLVVALLALSIGAVFLKYSSEQTMLKAKWQ